MKVYVVISRFMMGLQDCAIYSSRNAALNHIEEYDIGGNPGVLEMEVIGEPKKTRHVYTASCYDSLYEIHVLKGVYGIYEHAKTVAGENGLVLSRVIHDATVSA